MVTAELATALPVLMLLIMAGLSAVMVLSAHIRAQDAAAEAARALARNDPAAAAALVKATGPSGARLRVSPAGDFVRVEVVATVRLIATGWLPSVSVVADAVAAREPEPAQGSPLP
jgi:hypothetical protein